MTILLNLFDVKAEDEQKFMAAWEYSQPYFVSAPGTISIRLHRQVRPRRHMRKGQNYVDPESLAADAESGTIRFFNYVEWESAEAFEQAAATPEFHAAVSPLAEAATRTPQLFEIIREVVVARVEQTRT